MRSLLTHFTPQVPVRLNELTALNKLKKEAHPDLYFVSRTSGGEGLNLRLGIVFYKGAHLVMVPGCNEYQIRPARNQ